MLYELVLQDIKACKVRAESGEYNCIPFPYERFRDTCFPGIEREKYYAVTGNQKSAKSKFVDYTFVYEPFFDMIENNGRKMHWFYFTLEMSKKSKMLEFMCHTLYRMTGGSMRYSPRQARSVGKKIVFPDEALEIMESEQFAEICRKWEESVEYISDVKNPTGINKIIKEYSNKHGHLIFENEGTPEQRVVGYKDDEEDTWKMVIIDNLANLSRESGYTERENINKLSKYLIGARDLLGYIFVVIQHQMQAQEGRETFEFNKGKPTSAGLGNSKEISRDINMLFGIYSPFKMGLGTYKGYDITKLRNYARFVEVLEDRDGGATGEVLPLLFDGAVTIFEEMPPPGDSKEMEAFYQYAMQRDNSSNLFIMLKTNIEKTNFYFKTKRTIFIALQKIRILWEKWAS